MDFYNIVILGSGASALTQSFCSIPPSPGLIQITSLMTKKFLCFLDKVLTVYRISSRTTCIKSRDRMIHKFIHVNSLHRTLLYVFTRGSAHKVCQTLWRTHFAGLPLTMQCKRFRWPEYPQKMCLSFSIWFWKTKKSWAEANLTIGGGGQTSDLTFGIITRQKSYNVCQYIVKQQTSTAWFTLLRQDSMNATHQAFHNCQIN